MCHIFIHLSRNALLCVGHSWYHLHIYTSPSWEKWKRAIKPLKILEFQPTFYVWVPSSVNECDPAAHPQCVRLSFSHSVCTRSPPSLKTTGARPHEAAAAAAAATVIRATFVFSHTQGLTPAAPSALPPPTSSLHLCGNHLKQTSSSPSGSFFQQAPAAALHHHCCSASCSSFCLAVRRVFSGRQPRHLPTLIQKPVDPGDPGRREEEEEEKKRGEREGSEGGAEK